MRKTGGLFFPPSLDFLTVSLDNVEKGPRPCSFLYVEPNRIGWLPSCGRVRSIDPRTVSHAGRAKLQMETS